MGMIDKRKATQAAYGTRICSTLDGLPRVFTTNENLRGSIIPGAFLFIYITGWIGWAGREDLNRTADPMKELILDMPLVARCMLSGIRLARGLLAVHRQGHLC